ncbi:hypothetical protein I79_024926 [Cricetulus griseus]|uniref:Uncharacterized protein n=1 Tax=Cricetulus griseus TaxID=10029 RepID=G3ILZ9_CRIGR|nr:hypothetical protein I79_024926 [Cricetulus griseus]
MEDLKALLHSDILPPKKPHLLITPLPIGQAVKHVSLQGLYLFKPQNINRKDDVNCLEIIVFDHLRSKGKLDKHLYGSNRAPSCGLAESLCEHFWYQSNRCEGHPLNPISYLINSIFLGHNQSVHFDSDRFIVLFPFVIKILIELR